MISYDSMHNMLIITLLCIFPISYCVQEVHFYLLQPILSVHLISVLYLLININIDKNKDKSQIAPKWRGPLVWDGAL